MTMTIEGAQFELAQLSMAGDWSLHDLLRQVTEIAAATLKIDRVSIWRFLDGQRAIRCDFLYQTDSGQVSEGMVLHERDFPQYFEALAQRRAVPVTSFEGDPLMDEFRVSYFEPLGITSMLDAPIYQAGEVVGIVCHEHIGPMRRWSEVEVKFVVSVADTIGRMYEESARLQVEHELEAYRAHVMDVQRLGALGRLAAGMAHDFRNVLTAIYGYADLIAEAGKDHPQIGELVESMVSAASRGSRLTEELLALGQHVPSRPRVVDPRELLERFRDMLSMAAGSMAAVRIEAVESVSRVFIDPDQLERAILNLVMNARDAMAGGGVIQVSLGEGRRAHSSGREGTYVTVAVSDTGNGVDAATRARMFEPFFTTKGDGGTGLGLSIVQQIVTAAGGSIGVESTPGQGTTVSLYLPRIATPR